MVKLKLTKARQLNLKERKMGYIARVHPIGTADYEDVVSEACRNTTLHKTEAKMALELCMEAVVELLRQGWIVDLGAVGKLYPTCTGKWAESTADLRLADVKVAVRYRPARKARQALKGTPKQWVESKENEREAEEAEAATKD